jgi:glycosyltransferase involved in cell wall biosynthesis/O-antigen/teichoic acid export membrane protein
MPVRESTRGHVLFVSGASVAKVASSAVGALVATVVLGADERGLMVLGTNIGTVSAVLAGLGSSTALRLRLPGVTDPAGRRRVVSAYTWWSLAAAGVAAGLAVAASTLSAPVVDPALSGGGFLLAVAVFTAAQVLYWQTTDAWFAEGRFRRGSTSAALIVAGGLAGLLGAAAVADSAAWLLLAQGVGMATAWLLLLGGVRAARLLSSSRPRFQDIRALVGSGFPTLGLTVGLAIALRADRYVLGVTAGTAAVGVYALAVSLTEFSRVLPNAMGQLFMRDATLGTGRERLRRWVTLSITAAAAGNALVALASWALIVPIFGAEFAPARQLLLILALAEVCFAPYAVTSLGLVGGGWTGTAGALGVVGALGAVACYVAAARVAGATGVAAGSVIVYMGLSMASWLLLRRRLPAARVIARVRPEPAAQHGERAPALVYAVTIGLSARRNLRGQLGHLRACGYRVILMCTADEETRAYADREGIELIPLHLKRGFLAVRDVWAFLRAVRVLHRVRPALVCAATPKAGFVVGLAGLVSRVPARVYNLRGLRLEGERPGSWRYHLLRLAEYVTCRAAHVVLLPSESVRGRAISLGIVRPHKTRVLGRGSTNGVDLTRFRPVTPQARRTARGRGSLSPDAVVFGFVGRIVYDKGIDTLVDAFRALPGRVDAELLLVGDFEDAYPLPEWLGAGIRDDPRIHLTGDVDDTVRWYAAMDVLVLPSRREGLANVLLEAAATGLPSITTDVTGCRDATRHEVTGLVVPAGDAARLADAMTALAEDPCRRERMGAAGRRFVERHFDRAVVWSNTAEFVGTLVRAR